MQEEIVTPIPKDHLALLSGMSLSWIRILIDRGSLPALKLVQDEETLESILVPYTPRVKKAKPQSLFIAPDVAAEYVQIHRTTAHHIKQGEMVTPVPLSHLSKRVGIGVESLYNAIDHGNLQAVEFVFDADLLSSSLVLYVPNSESRQGKALYVLPAEAKRFVEAKQQQHAKFLASRHTEPMDINPGFEQEVLKAAQAVKQEHPQGIVERKKVQERMTVPSYGKEQIKAIKYIMDQHLNEFPPPRRGPYTFLAKKEGE
ncbi:MAG TPA: hypothetical protein VHV10_05050 [Ktedonobacteraceae bacterium]|jgi:hypothetical protein|nr:hypothetical protein [Ktedonobacteraceae bacterium]